MAARDVARALMAMDDPEVRRRVGQGEFGALGTLELSIDEQALVSAATPVLPEGHPSKVLVAVEPGDVQAHSASPGEDSGYWSAGTAQAIEYVHNQLDDPRTQAQFSSWVRARGDEFP